MTESGPGQVDWQPACSLLVLRQRAELNARIREFFMARGGLEVETPLLGRHTVTDPALRAFATEFALPGQSCGRRLFLQTSPEYAMKRLLAAGAGSIFQICKAFRNEESGRFHNPEFSLLEWYRTGFTLDQLVDEVEDLIARLAASHIALVSPERFSYAEICLKYLGLDPLTADIRTFDRCAQNLGLPEAAKLCGDDRSVWLDLLFSRFVQPRLGVDRLTTIFRYPAFMPSLARVCTEDSRVVERAEIFLAGQELGNGFYELADANEQQIRFQNDLKARSRQGLPAVELDQRLLGALRAGLPDCAGIAIGLDRLLMVLMGKEHIDEVLAFPVTRA
ncbi:MAG: EF-P lysine aminoacylase GenX [Methylococcus sp.]|nr:MAG: EF-P lysine aminoacylase GenX [Methylococcus sp.]